MNTSTSPNVQYTFAGGSSNTIRSTGIVYPNGNTLAYAYGTSGDVNDLLSRSAGLVSNGTDVTDYTYLGLDTPVIHTFQITLVAIQSSRHYPRHLSLLDWGTIRIMGLSAYYPKRNTATGTGTMTSM